MALGIDIQGGAGPEIAGAIVAVVTAIDQLEREAASVRPRPIRQSQWVRAGRQLDRHAPSTSVEYDRLPGLDLADDGQPPS
jgi:hypothetical protein